VGQFSKNYITFYSKNFQFALKNIGLESGIRKKPIPDPGSRGQKGTGSRIRIRNTGFYYRQVVKTGFCQRDLGKTNEQLLHFNE
jgi:hypothetical protein